MSELPEEKEYPAVLESEKPARPLPGDLPRNEIIERMLRVDHAGEYGAVRIYQGQMAILGDRHEKSPMIKHMAEQEVEHLDRFNKIINERGVRPTALTPVWDAAGFALGAATAFLGPKAAMACTQAVEEVIDGHYEEQLQRLRTEFKGEEPELEAVIEKFQAEEVEHKRLAEEHGAEEAVAHPLLTGAIKAGCRAAIWLAKRV